MEEAAQGLLGAVLTDIDEERKTGHRHLGTTEYWLQGHGLLKQKEMKSEEETHSRAAWNSKLGVNSYQTRINTHNRT